MKFKTQHLATAAIAFAATLAALRDDIGSTRAMRIDEALRYAPPVVATGLRINVKTRA